MALYFDWDRRKALRNLAKHGVSFDEARSVFGDPLSSTIPDPAHSSPTEERFAIIGSSHRGRLLVVIHLDHGHTIRIISARRATRHERNAYEKSP